MAEAEEQEKRLTTTTIEGEDNKEGEGIWGTWEELLLVSAVNRHGTQNWESVAMEIQNRITSSSSSSSKSHFLLTPDNCETRYLDLRRRLKKIYSENDELDDDTIPWLEELRKLRVAELRREVEQYDVSIVSLQLKVKRLKEEREHSSKQREENGEVKTDLETDNQNSVAEKHISGEDSDRENQSFNESNSSDPKPENRPKSPDTKPETDRTVAGGIDPVGNVLKPAGEGSCNGSSETIAKNSNSPVSQAFTLEPIQKRETRGGGGGESTELWESVAESKEVEMKENSDVQSSASLSHRRKKNVSVSSSGDLIEIDEISPAIKRLSVKSQPLFKILEIIKGHKFGSVFERRLESQETSKYKNLIRQHLDLETVSKRLNEGKYSGSSRKFFRDLLLLINNAIVFFSPNSVEFTAAIELRQIVSKEMGTRVRKSSQLPEGQPPPAPTIPPPALTNPDPEPLESLLVKPKITIPTIASRKRTPVSTKASIVVSERKKEAVVVDEKKPVFAHPVEEQIVINKGKRERPASGTRSSRTVGRNQNNNSNKNSNVNSIRNASPSSNPSSSGKGLAVDDNSETKTDKEKKNGVTSVAKKQSVANFLNRMKRNTTSNGTLLESLKNSGNNSSNGKGSNAEPKRGSGGRGDTRKEHPTKQSLSRKQAREQSSPAKRGVGRPPKRNASSPITPPLTSKRARESTEKEVAASRQPRKRSRR